MKLELYTQPFCAPCIRAHHSVKRAAELLPDLEVEEINVVEQVERGMAQNITSTPVIRLLVDGEEKFRGTDSPTLNQLLTAIAAAGD